MTYGRKGRYRERMNPSRQGTFVIGITENQKKINNVYVATPDVIHHASVTNRRFYSFVESCHDVLHWPGPPYTFGDNFDHVRGLDGGLTVAPMTSGGWVYHGVGGIYRSKYVGGWMPNWYPPAPFTLTSTFNSENVDFPDLSSYGPSAYAMYSPTKPSVDLGQFFAEFREIPKMLFSAAQGFKNLWRSMGGHKKTFTPKRVADEFLGYQFGWVPFIGTLVDFHNTMKNLHQKVERIKRYNGVWEHRGGPVDAELVSEDLIYEAASVSKTYPSISSAFNTSGSVKIYKRHTRDVWFSGYFRYYIPELLKYTSWWQPEIFKMILGLKISPSLLWEVTPFSWLFDWFGNVGDILANASDAELYNLVSRNAFLMGKTNVRFDFEAVRRCGPVTHNRVWTYSYERKQRVKASPYGFNVQFKDLSAKQIGILGALGVSTHGAF